MKKSKQSISKDKKEKQFVVCDLDSLQKEFYRTYNPGYWLYKIHLLKNSHDNYESINDALKTNLSEVEDDAYKRMLRTELHFLYFQMVETLFEIIFALSRPGFDNRDLWIALTFSSDRQTVFYSDSYKKIKEFSEGKLKDPDLSGKVITEIQGGKVEMPLLQWIFYFVYPLKMTENEKAKNLENIKNLLHVFAEDFTDRGEYNAYKHSLRFYNAPVSMSIMSPKSQAKLMLGKSNDAITYLEEYNKKDKTGKTQANCQIARTTKPFNFERDYRCCMTINELIKNIINTRKYSFLDELHGKDFQFTTFLDINVPQLEDKKTGIIKSSFTV